MARATITTGALADILGIPARTVRHWVQQGWIVPDRLSGGGRAFFTEKTARRIANRHGKERLRPAA